MSIEIEHKTDMPDLFQASVSELEIINPIIRDGEIIHKIEQKIYSGDPYTHIYTKDLNVNGVAIQDSFEKYLSNEAIQGSRLKQALKTPLHFYFAKDEDKQELEKIQGKKKYFELGTFLHQCILEPTLFSRVLVEPKYDLSTSKGVQSLIEFWENKLNEMCFIVSDEKEIPCDIVINNCKKAVSDSKLSLDNINGKRAYCNALREATGITPVSSEHFIKINILKKQLDKYGDGIIYKILKKSKREISFYYTNENGTNLKVRPDALQFEENIGVNAIISVKSTSCEDLQAFYYNAAKFHYDLSEAMYQDVISKVTGRNFNATIMIMLQTVEPFAVALLVWDNDDIEVGRYKYNTALSITEKSINEGIFKGYESFADNDLGLIQMKLPNWNNKELLPTI